MEMPSGLTYYTADEVAECLPYREHLPAEYGDWGKLYSKLWSILSDAKNPTPLGGDGSDGTVELPEDRLELDNDDKAVNWWSQLTPIEQNAIACAYADEFGDSP